MRRIFGQAVHRVAIAWRAGNLTSDAAMERIYRLLMVGEREEYVEMKYDAARVEVERGILARNAGEIIDGRWII